VNCCHLKKYFVAALLILLCSIFSARALSSEVLIFDYTADDSVSEKWVGIALTDYSIRILNSSESGKAMDRERLKKIISRWTSGKSNNLSFETKDAIRVHAGAVSLIECEINEDPSGIHFIGTIINPDSGILKDISFSIKEFDLHSLKQSLLNKLVEEYSLSEIISENNIETTSSDIAYTRYWQAMYSYENGMIDKAYSLFEKAAELDPGYVEAFIMKGKILLEKTRFSEAIEHLKHSIEIDPENAKAHFLLGLTYYFQRQNIPARIEFDKALELDPGNPEYHYQTGLYSKEKFNYKRALEELTVTVEMDPSIYFAWYHLATIYASLKNDQKALDCLQEAARWGKKNILPMIENDSDLDLLRGNPRFLAIVRPLK